MKNNSYTFAALTDEEVEKIKQTEEQLTRELGHAITLIAYQPESEGGTPLNSSGGNSQ